MRWAIADGGLAIEADVKAVTSSGVGGRPVRSKVARRMNVRASAGGASGRSEGRRAARKASMGFAEEGETGRGGEGETAAFIFSLSLFRSFSPSCAGGAPGTGGFFTGW